MPNLYMQLYKAISHFPNEKIKNIPKTKPASQPINQINKQTKANVLGQLEYINF